VANPVPSSQRRYGGLTPAERDADRRQRLLNAGLDAFGTSGYPATSVEALCGAAGVSTRNFYDHFAGRESLLIAIFDEGIARAQAATVEALAALPADASVRDRAQAGLAAFVDYMLGDERRARINFIEVVGASRAVEAHRRTALRTFAGIILQLAEALADAGRIAPRPPHFFRVGSIALVGAVVEALLEWMADDGDRMPLDQVIDGLVEIIVILAGEPD
jgi:AcrR family transcriptional regulator